MYWLTLSWWKYLLEPKSEDVSWWTVFWCRAKGHAGVSFYDVSGYEPDMHCKNCGDDLG